MSISHTKQQLKKVTQKVLEDQLDSIVEKLASNEIYIAISRSVKIHLSSEKVKKFIDERVRESIIDLIDDNEVLFENEDVNIQIEKYVMKMLKENLK